MGEAIVMENEDFELNFADGARFASSEAKTEFKDANGKLRSTEVADELISSQISQQIKHAKTQHRAAKRIERSGFKLAIGIEIFY